MRVRRRRDADPGGGRLDDRSGRRRRGPPAARRAHPARQQGHPVRRGEPQGESVTARPKADVKMSILILQESDHYICSSDARIICLPGWSEPERLCRTPVCRFLDLPASSGGVEADVVSKERNAEILLIAPHVCRILKFQIQQKQGFAVVS